MSKDSSKDPPGKWWWQTDFKNPEKNFGGPFRVVLTTLLIFILAQAAALLIVGLAAGVSSLDNSVPAQFFYVLIGEGGAALAVLALAKRRRINLASIGFGRRPKTADLWRGLGGFAAFYILLVVSISILGMFFPELNTDQKQDVGFNNLATGTGTALAFISLVLLPPLGEETLMRGYLYSGLRSRWRVLPAMIAASLLFGLAHLEFGSGAPILWAAGVDTFILSLVLVYLRETTGALYAGILVHMLNNAVAFAVYIR